MPRRLLVVLPSWVGDAVMATPMLRAVRRHLPEAHVTALARPYVRPVVDACPWIDRLLTARPPRPGATTNRRRGTLGLAARLRTGRFDTALLLPNSMRSAATTRLAGIPRRIGYARQGRGALLTERLHAPRSGGSYTPISAVDYYLALAGHLGADISDRRVELFTRSEDDARAQMLLQEAGVVGERPVVLLNPGAATKGDTKLWPAERFAALADRHAEMRGAQVLLNGGPKDRPVLDAVRAAARVPLIDLPARGNTLRGLKSVTRRCDLVITNDTGGRHIAAGMGAALISLFGPTDPRWAQLDLPRETILHAADGRMDSIAVETVWAAIEEALAEPAP